MERTRFSSYGSGCKGSTLHCTLVKPTQATRRKKHRDERGSEGKNKEREREREREKKRKNGRKDNDIFNHWWN